MCDRDLAGARQAEPGPVGDGPVVVVAAGEKLVEGLGNVLVGAETARERAGRTSGSVETIGCPPCSAPNGLLVVAGGSDNLTGAVDPVQAVVRRAAELDVVRVLARSSN